MPSIAYPEDTLNTRLALTQMGPKNARFPIFTGLCWGTNARRAAAPAWFPHTATGNKKSNRQNVAIRRTVI
jgi:hypothetical protein